MRPKGLSRIVMALLAFGSASIVAVATGDEPKKAPRGIKQVLTGEESGEAVAQGARARGRPRDAAPSVASGPRARSGAPAGPQRFASTRPAVEQAQLRDRSALDLALGEEPADAAAVASTELLRQSAEFLLAHGARSIEGLKEDDLKDVAQLSPRDADKLWRSRLAELAREEAGRRGLTDHPFPAPPAPDSPEPRGAMDVGQDGLEILARIVKGETWPGTPRVGMVAVASVVLNRVLAQGYPDTIAGVAHQPYQFSCYNADVRGRLYWGPIRDEAWPAAQAAADGVDPVPGATHYYNPYLVKPSWAKSMKFVKRIGTTPQDTHDFYRR